MKPVVVGWVTMMIFFKNKKFTGAGENCAWDVVLPRPSSWNTTTWLSFCLPQRVLLP
jgi:hypothetical protein